MSKDSTSDNGKWRYDGVKVVSGQHLDVNTPQTEGMNRAAAINHATAGAEKLVGRNGSHSSRCQDGRSPSW